MAAVLGGIFLSCAGGAPVFKLGGVGPVTGEAATFGVSTKQGIEMAVAEWNAQGGVLGKQIRLAFADDKGDPAEGATVYTKLIQQDGVSAIVGTVMSKVSLAGAPICQSYKIPMISTASTNPKVTEVGDYVFRACFIDPFQGTVGAMFAYDDLKARTAAVIFDVGNDYRVDSAVDVPQSVRSALLARLGLFGVRVAVEMVQRAGPSRRRPRWPRSWPGSVVSSGCGWWCSASSSTAAGCSRRARP